MTQLRYHSKSRAEHLIATGRVILAGFFLLAVWLDPSEPSSNGDDALDEIRRSAKHALGKLLKREVAGLLTQREIELVHMVARGSRNREIADKLCISEGTVKVHLHNIYQKINVDGRVALLRYAQEKGLT